MAGAEQERLDEDDAFADAYAAGIAAERARVRAALEAMVTRAQARTGDHARGCEDALLAAIEAHL
jgi:hypothetical protein